jgi:hypothetical protein
MLAWRRGRAYSQDLRDRVLSADGVGSGEVTPGAQRSHTPPKLAGHYNAIAAPVAWQPA